MTIRQQGGVFGRNPTFNNLDVTGTVTADGLTVDTNTFHVDSTNNRIGIGTTSPSGLIELYSATDPIMYLNRGGIYSRFLTDSSGTLKIQADQGNTGASSSIQFFVDGSKRATIDSSGNVLVGTTTSPSGSGQIVANGGVYLGGTVAANLLDDYEEGTWTPTTAGDATGVITVGDGSYYTKVGNLVSVVGNFRVTTNFTSSDIGGLPFSISHSGTPTSWISGGPVLGNVANTIHIGLQHGQSTMRFYSDQNQNGPSPLTTTINYYRFAFTYRTS